MKKLQEKLEFLFDKYDVEKKAEIISFDLARIDGKEMKLLPWRAERRFTELKNLVVSGNLTGLSTMRITHIAHKGSDLYKILWREADIFEFVTGEKICEIFAVENSGTVLNAIAKSQNGVVCTFELSATLPQTQAVVDKHEIIAVSGNACDRAVDTQYPQSSIYVLDEENTVFTDVDTELFGLLPNECALVRHVFDLARSAADTNAVASHIDAVVTAAQTSVSTVDNVRV